jgi:predicted DsbA family dithiol-disulfide isomerase
MTSRMPLERVEKAKKHMASVATGEGITLNFGGKTGNSRLSHQLLSLAKTESLEMQGKVAEEVFRLHFQEEGDITDMEMLVIAGVNCGLDEMRIREWLSDEEKAKAVDEEVQEARKMGVKGVPKFFLQGEKEYVDGAGDLMDFFEIFMKIKEGENDK